MEKITGIKSVDFKITALGYGVVNWNGPTTLTGNDGKTVDNHTLPKLRGYTNLTGKIKEDSGYKYKKEIADIDFKKNPLYISQNCIRHHLFKHQSFDWHYLKTKTIPQALTSIKGLVNGYVVPESQCKRTSALLLEDFIDELGNGNFEQFSSNSMKEEKDSEGNTTYKRDENSIFSKTTFGDTKYTAYGSISLEQLQFISLDNKFDRAAMIVKEGEGEKLAEQIQEFLQTLDNNLNPIATFHDNYVRSGTIFEEGENGILLNQDAMQILVNTIIDIIKNLSIKQAKGYMYIDEVELDYNDSNKMMRIKRGDSTNPQKNNDFATYFYAKN